MTDVSLLFISIILLFVFFFLLKKKSTMIFCVLCLSVSTTWIGMLVWYWVKKDGDPLLIGVLMGQSAVGVLYLIEKHLPEQYLIFRFPFLLSMTAAIVSILGYHDMMTIPLLLVGMVWIVTGSIFLLRVHPRMRRMAKDLIACCKNW